MDYRQYYNTANLENNKGHEAINTAIETEVKKSLEAVEEAKKIDTTTPVISKIKESSQVNTVIKPNRDKINLMVVGCSSLNIRKGPNKESSSIGLFAKGALVVAKIPMVDFVKTKDDEFIPIIPPPDVDCADNVAYVMRKFVKPQSLGV